ncbi:toprim domain-containing protein [Agrobacterium tumefaciens]|uniref:toprim domain-containing protein n=1 Tax=Agrobacterium tumefaciens TaxID=358 RepID=UPI0038514FF2
MLFRFGAIDALRLCVTEAAIDAMSLAAFEGLREGSLYLSTGGGWSPNTEAAIRRRAVRLGTQLVAATDANIQGETFASRLRDIADEAGCDWLRLTPPADDWNDALRAREAEKKQRENVGRRGLPHARRSRQG